MKQIAWVAALAAALAAFPAAAYESGGEHDPFSQGYTGRDPEEVRAEREREQKASPRDAACPCGHKKADEKSASKK